MGPLETESGAPAAEVSVSFDGAIVEVRHLVDAAREELRLGGGGFPLDDPRLPEPGLPLVRGRGGGFHLFFAPDTFDRAEILLDGERLSLPDWIAGGAASSAREEEGAFTCPLRFGARFRVTLGRCTFEVTGCAPPSRFALAPPLDWRQLLFTGATALAMSLCLLVYLVVPHGSSSRGGADVAPEVVASAHLLFPSEAAGGASPFGSGTEAPAIGRAFEARASRGGAAAQVRPQREEPIAQRHARATSPAPISAEEVRTQAAAAAQKAGILDALRDDEGSHLGSLFGRDDALGDDADRAMGSITSDVIGDEPDPSGGGDGLIGSGLGGGGSGEGTIGLGTLGTIGHGSAIGSGYGVAGGRGALVHRRAHMPEVIIRQPEVGPEYDPSLVRRVVRAHLAEVRYCYERELIAHPSLDGRLLATFTVATSGRVVASAIASSTLADPEVGNCVAQAIGRWRFPAPRGGVIIIHYPFAFAPAP